MIETEKDPEITVKSPFQEEAVLENYIPCANRGEVLSQIEEAVHNGVTLMVLTGEEGSGKTMICRLLEHELSPKCTTVFFHQTVDSFEDVVRMIAMRLGLDAVIEKDSIDVDLVLESISDFLVDASVDLFIIVDEAENLFLATLERIRKMLDRIVGSGARIHILLSGRETLLENCDQLSICDFQNTDDLHFELTSLSKIETGHYLQNCCTGLTDLDATKVFSDEVVAHIYSLANGNIRTTNLLGEESVKSHSADTSFMVLLDGVKEGFGSENEASYATKYSQLINKFVAYLPWAGGGLCCLLLFFYLFGSGGDENDVNLDIHQSEKAVQIEVVTPLPEAIVQPPKEEEPAETVQALDENTTVPRFHEQNVLVGETAVVLPVEKSGKQDVDQLQSLVVEGAATEDGAVLEKAGVFDNVTVAEEGETVPVEVKELQNSQETSKKEVADIVRLRPNDDLKKKLVLSPEPQRVVIKVQSRKEVRVISGAGGHSTADQLYDNRVLAGLGWKGSEKENMYTVQLMVLASKTAEKNLKKMLVQVEYRQEAGNFYIFKKGTGPENIFVFYGEYPSIERARLVKNSLPKFLRDHKPYVLSIQGALAKVRK
jgi:type II secretory pathway predicted ATPase ExeA/septal ring-binding cell division protein DamX